MVSAKELSQNNAGVDIAGERALVSGGTQGIGAGIALRYALAGASVYIVGRSEGRAKEVLDKLKQASAEYARRRERNATSLSGEATYASTAAKNISADHDFFQADLTDPAAVKGVVEKVREKTGGAGVDHLVMTQGGPPLGALEALPSGIEKAFAVQVLSRFGLAYLLASQGLLKKSASIVCAPGGGSKQPLDVNDLDLLKAKKAGKIWDGYVLGMIRRGQRDSSVVDAFSQKLAEDYPQLSVAHLFPGIVQTDAAQNKGLPAPLVWGSKLVMPLIASVPGPGGYAEVPFYLQNHPEGKKYIRLSEANLFNEKLKRSELSPNVRDPSVRQQIWDKLASYF